MSLRDTERRHWSVCWPRAGVGRGGNLRFEISEGKENENEKEYEQEYEWGMGRWDTLA